MVCKTRFTAFLEYATPYVMAEWEGKRGGGVGGKTMIMPFEVSTAKWRGKRL